MWEKGSTFYLLESTLKKLIPSLENVLKEGEKPLSDDAMSQEEFAQWGTTERLNDLKGFFQSS